MAKQTFTTGQVLTAAQMTSLQQTAMGGGSTTAKTVSYVLVAADAGTVVQMNAAGATTITVNTALFAAGDTVEIQNVGAGVCTVTAGTVTVNTSSTLALKQYDAGSLYFNTTSAAIFFATDAADSTSPLTTKGDLYTFSTLDARLPVGSNNQTLVADSAEATGLKWATPSSGGMTLLSTTTLSGSTTSISSINQTYTHLQVIFYNVRSSVNNETIRYRPNNYSTANGYFTGMSVFENGNAAGNESKANIYSGVNSSTVEDLSVLDIPFYSTSGTRRILQNTGVGSSGTTAANFVFQFGSAFSKDTTAVSSLTIFPDSGTLSGTVYIYGVK